MKVLVFGAQGQLGRCLNDQLINTNYDVVYSSREQIDISNFEQTKNNILKISPDLIINATAYTAVDRAESDQKTANLINHLAVKNIAEICCQQGCRLIHLSTDYVFDGNSTIPYKECDKANPQSVYGRSKLEGELAIQSSGCSYIIIRTAWLFSEYGNNFLKTMLRLGMNRDEISVVGDQFGCPTYAQDIARSIVEISTQLKSKKHSGIYHYSGDQPCSWYDFANAIFDQAKLNNLQIPSIVKSIKTSAYPTPAERPIFSVLNCSKIENDFDVHISNWHEGVKKALGKLLVEFNIP